MKKIYQHPNKKLFDERIKPFYIDGIAVSLSLVAMTCFAGYALTIDYIPKWFPPLFIGFAFIIELLLVLKRDYRVMIGYHQKNLKESKVRIVDIKPYGNAKGTHFDSWYSFYPNSEVKLFTITIKNTCNDNVTVMQMYLTQEEADYVVQHKGEANTYEIKFIENAKVIYEIIRK